MITIAHPSQEHPSERVEGPLNDADHLAEGVDDIDESGSSNFGNPKLWDPHMGLKPLELDDCTSDGDLETESMFPDGAESKVNNAMIGMMANMDEWDA